MEKYSFEFSDSYITCQAAYAATQCLGFDLRARLGVEKLKLFDLVFDHYKQRATKNG